MNGIDMLKKVRVERVGPTMVELQRVLDGQYLPFALLIEHEGIVNIRAIGALGKHAMHSMDAACQLLDIDLGALIQSCAQVERSCSAAALGAQMRIVEGGGHVTPPKVGHLVLVK